jgi:hypothetical protein
MVTGGIELVSPIFDASTPWSTHLSLIFRVLRSSFTVTTSSNTSTHIHVSTLPALPPEYLAALSKAILYFEPAMDGLLPAARASSYWCQSNHDSTMLKSLSLNQCFEYLDYCGDATSVARTMCLFSARSTYGRANGYTEDFVHGVYKWDFSRLVDPTSCLVSNTSPSGTLEFRQCPGSTSADEARTWLVLAVGFVAGAIDTAGTIKPGAQVTMEELWWTINAGLQSLGLADGEARLMDKLFSGRKMSKGGRKWVEREVTLSEHGQASALG